MAARLTASKPGCDARRCEYEAVADVEVDDGVHMNVCVRHSQYAEESGLIVEWWANDAGE